MRMSSMRRTGVSLAVTAFAALAALPAHAQQQIVIGTPQGQNLFPFGFQFFSQAYAAGGEYQQIYSSSDFQSAVSGPVLIRSIGFASSSLTSATHATYDVTISFSTTSSSMNNPAPNFSANEGTDFTQVFNGVQTAALQGNNTFDLTFATSPFLYNAGSGNLLADIVINNPTEADGFVYFASTGPNQTGRVFQSFGQGPAKSSETGLYTEFGVTPVPEASTAAGTGILLCLGVLAAAVRRRRRAASSAE